MKVSVRCPNCRQKYQVGHRVIGRTIPCGKCGVPFTATPKRPRVRDGAPVAQPATGLWLDDGLEQQLASGPTIDRDRPRIHWHRDSDSDRKLRVVGWLCVLLGAIPLVLRAAGLGWQPLYVLGSALPLLLLLVIAGGAALLWYSWRHRFAFGLTVAGAVVAAGALLAVVEMSTRKDAVAQIAVEESSVESSQSVGGGLSTSNAAASGASAVDPLAIAPRETIDLQPKFAVGDSISLEVIKSRSRTDKGPSANTKASYNVDIEVLEASDNGYLLEWKTSNFRILEPTLNSRQAQLVSSLIGPMTFEGLSIKIRMDQDANLLGVENWNEVKAKIDSLIPEFINKLRPQLPNPNMADSLGQTLRRVYQTDAAQGLVAKEAGAYFGPFGPTYEPGETIVEKRAAPTALGGDPIAADLQYKLEWHDTTASTAGILVTQYFGAAETRAAMRQVMSVAAELAGKPMPSSMAMPPDLAISDVGRYTIDLNSGWVKSAKHERKITAEGHSQSDVLEFKLLSAD